MDLFSELKLSVPWGHIAAKAWGSLQGPPVLCLHGWLDNANSFDRLIPLLPQTFYYVAMDFGGHGLSSHHHPGFPYHQQDYVNEVLRVAAALKWKRFSLLGHSFGGTVGSMFSYIFPEMVDKLILLDSSPFFLDAPEMNNLLVYRRRRIEHVLQVEAKQQKPRNVVSPEDMLQSFLKNNFKVGEECGKLLLERGTTKVAEGVMLNRDRRLGLTENHIELVSKNQLEYFCMKMQARVLHIKATEGYVSYGRENQDEIRDSLQFVQRVLKSTLKERYQYVEVTGNHYVHMQEPQRVAGIISDFLESNRVVQAHL
ncbi:serine hydrolase-like protein 2 isoform X2 [Phascolarctos cinereus]|uniref:Serine hydrolase-like protein 2 isoform X2 n=1 Tax=Phascolarctos cinereus TaxID=38626 RepID=A0A6P5K014_PHACI|nr:serine hydrolase-like protein 2 isoform X2 [Phascolarctos cinereus]